MQAGDHVDFHLHVRDATDQPVADLPVRYWIGPKGTSPPKDDEEDYGLPIWAGVLPLRMTSGPPEPDPRLSADLPVPMHAQRFALE